MENLNRVLLENVLPAHVAEHFLARNWKNEVRKIVTDKNILLLNHIVCLILSVGIVPKSHMLFIA